VEHVNRIFIPAGGHPLDRDMVDSKGFAWLDSVMPRDIRFDTLASLDTLDPHAFETRKAHPSSRRALVALSLDRGAGA